MNENFLIAIYNSRFYFRYLTLTPSHSLRSNTVFHCYIRLRKLTAAAGVLAPQALRFSVPALCSGDLDAQLAAFPFPCVLKPLSGAGSHFVRRIASVDVLKAVVAEYRDEAASTGEVAAWGAESADEAFMIEEMLVGKEVDIDLLIDNVRQNHKDNKLQT